MGDNISTVGASFSTVEGIHYIEGITSVHVGDNISTVEGIQHSEGYLQYSGGITSVLWRLLSTVVIKI